MPDVTVAGYSAIVGVGCDARPGQTTVPCATAAAAAVVAASTTAGSTATPAISGEHAAAVTAAAVGLSSSSGGNVPPNACVSGVMLGCVHCPVAGAAAGRNASRSATAPA